MIWQYGESSYFIQNSDCKWNELQNNEIVDTYRLVQSIESLNSGETSIILLSESDANFYIHIFERKAFYGTKRNEIKRFLYNGKWVKVKKSSSNQCLSNYIGLTM